MIEVLLVQIIAFIVIIELAIWLVKKLDINGPMTKPNDIPPPWVKTDD